MTQVAKGCTAAKRQRWGRAPVRCFQRPVSAGASEPFLGKKLDVHFLNVCDSCDLFHAISVLILIQKYVLHPLPPETKKKKKKQLLILQLHVPSGAAQTPRVSQSQAEGPSGPHTLQRVGRGCTRSRGAVHL